MTATKTTAADKAKAKADAKAAKDEKKSMIDAAIKTHAIQYVYGETTREKLVEDVAHGSEQLTAAEINQVADAIMSAAEKKAKKSAADAAKHAEDKNEELDETENEHYEEWRMERVNIPSRSEKDEPTSRLVKLKLVRPTVKITESEAATLNEGALAPGSTNPIMYILPGNTEYDA